MPTKTQDQQEVFRDFSHPDPVPEKLRKEIQEQSDIAKMLYSMAQIKIPDLIRTT